MSKKITWTCDSVPKFLLSRTIGLLLMSYPAVGSDWQVCLSVTRYQVFLPVSKDCILIIFIVTIFTVLFLFLWRCRFVLCSCLFLNFLVLPRLTRVSCTLIQCVLLKWQVILERKEVCLEFVLNIWNSDPFELTFI